MNKTKIEWSDYTWNPIVGCKRGCFYCYARKMHQRFCPDLPFNHIVNYDERLKQPLKVKRPSRIFVGSMTDIEYWSKTQMDAVLDVVRQCPRHTFLFLTKCPYRYRDFDFTFNCWLGTTITSRNHTLIPREISSPKFISFEPLLEDVGVIDLFDIQWVIIGALTGPDSKKYQPKKQWIENILKEAARFNIPVFMKNNLKLAWSKKLIQEYPESIAIEDRRIL